MITFEGLVFLLLGIFGGRLTSVGFTGGYFGVNSPYMLRWNLTPVGFLVDLIAFIGFLGSLWLAHRGWTERAKYRYFLKFGIFLFFLLLFFLMVGRGLYGTTYGSHDGLIQSELAAKNLLHGINPYNISYKNTPFEAFHLNTFGQSVNPVLDHYPYPPLIILLHTPVVVWSMITGWGGDGRILTAVAYLWLVVLVLRLSKNYQYRTWVAMFFLVNPFLTLFPLIGMNDIFFLLFMVGAVLLARRGSWLLAGAILGLALAAKQTAFLAVPLWAWWMWQEVQSRRISMKMAWQSLAWTGAVAAVIYLPFIAWNPSAFYDDVIRFVSGSIPYAYPIGGDSLYQFAVMGRLVPNAWAATRPFLGLLLAAAISLPIGMWWIRQRPTASQLLTSVTMVTLVVSLANRYFFENYVSSLILLAAVSMAIAWVDRHDRIAPASRKQ